MECLLQYSYMTIIQSIDFSIFFFTRILVIRLENDWNITMKGQSNETDHEQMSRIIDIEQPLHAFPFATLSIVHGQYRNAQKGKHLKHTI